MKPKDPIEIQIFQQVAKTFNFEIRENDVKCLECGKRIMYNYSGMPTNERMIQHAQLMHGRRYPTEAEKEQS